MARDPWRLDRQTGSLLSWMAHITGRYYAPQSFCTSQTTVTPTVNTLYAQPIFIPVTKTYDRISMEVTTQDVDNLTRLGIYNNGSSVPSTLVLDAGTVSLTGTGAKEITISQSLTGPTWYWLAYVSDSGAAVYRGWTQTAALPFVGVPSGTLTGTNTNFFAWSVAFTFAALPTPFTGGGALSNGGPAAAKILLRAG